MRQKQIPCRISSGEVNKYDMRLLLKLSVCLACPSLQVGMLQHTLLKHTLYIWPRGGGAAYGLDEFVARRVK